jgi:hypothetical protein
MQTLRTSSGRGSGRARCPRLENLEDRSLLTTGIPTGIGLMVSGATFNATSGSNAPVMVSTFSDTDPGATLSDFSATVKWGDGSTSPGNIALILAGSNPTYSISATHAYASAGSYDVTVQITETRNNLVDFVHSAAVVQAPVAAPAPLTVSHPAPGPVGAHPAAATHKPVIVVHAPVVHRPVIVTPPHRTPIVKPKLHK